MNKKANPEEVKAVQITIKLTQEDKDKLDAVAKRNSITRSNVLRELIKRSSLCEILDKD